MQNLIGGKDFQDILKSKLTLANRARMSAVCKSSRNLCDAKDARRQVMKIVEAQDAFWMAFVTALSKIGEFDNNVFQYIVLETEWKEEFFSLLQTLQSRRPDLADRLVYFIKMGLLVMAFAMDNPAYGPHLKKLGDREPLTREEGVALSKEFSESGLGHIFVEYNPSHRSRLANANNVEFVDEVTGHTYRRMIIEDFPKIADVVRELLAIHMDRDLQFLLTIARTSIIETFRTYKALYRDMLNALEYLQNTVKELDRRELDSIIRDIYRTIESSRTLSAQAEFDIASSIRTLGATLRTMIPPR